MKSDFFDVFFLFPFNQPSQDPSILQEVFSLSPGGGAKRLPVRSWLDLIVGASESAARDVGGRFLAVQGES